MVVSEDPVNEGFYGVPACTWCRVLGKPAPMPAIRTTLEEFQEMGPGPSGEEALVAAVRRLDAGESFKRLSRSGNLDASDALESGEESGRSWKGEKEVLG